MITVDPAAASPIEGTETLGQAMADQPPTFDTVGTDEDDTAVILYTSGTTGQPKGAELRHRNMRDNALLGTELFGADAENPDTLLCVLPLFHSFGQSVIQNGGFAYGGTVVMLPRFDADASLKTMAKEGVTFFAGVPTMYWGLLGALGRLGRRRQGARGQPPGGGGRRLGAAGRGAQGLRAALRRHHPGGVRAVRDLAGGELLAVRQGRAGRLDRRRRPGRGDEADRARHLGRDRGRARRDRRDRDQGPQHHEGLLQPAGRDRRGDPGRLVPLRRPGPTGRGRLVLHRRPVQGHDHPRRLQRVPPRDRGGPDDPPRRLAGRRDRRTAREPRRGDQGRGDPQQRTPRSPRTSWSPGARSRWPTTSTPGWSSSWTPSR